MFQPVFHLCIICSLFDQIGNLRWGLDKDYTLQLFPSRAASSNFIIHSSCKRIPYTFLHRCHTWLTTIRPIAANFNDWDKLKTGFMGAAVLIFTILVSSAWTSLNEAEKQSERWGKLQSGRLVFLCECKCGGYMCVCAFVCSSRCWVTSRTDL